jgi:hypothetical protein
METQRKMTQSPVALARTALRIGKVSLPAFSSIKSRHDFTQPQLLAILVLKQFFKTDYRGIIEFLGDFPNLMKILGLKKVPHYSTLCYAHQRLLKKGF